MKKPNDHAEPTKSNAKKKEYSMPLSFSKVSNNYQFKIVAY